MMGGTVTLAATEIDCSLGDNNSITLYLPGGPYWNTTVTPFIQIYTLNITDYTSLDGIPDVATVIPVLEQKIRQIKYGSVYGVPLDNASLLKDYPSILPANIIQGRNLQTGDSGVVVVQERLAKIFNINVGGTLNLLGKDFKVVGLEGTEPINTTLVTMSLADAQMLTNTSGQASGFKIFVDNVNNVNTVVSRIKTDYPKLPVSQVGLSLVNTAEQVQAQTNQQIQAAQNTMSLIQNIGLVEISVAVIADAAIVLFIMQYSVRERTKEIGTFKAMGANNTTVLGQILFEGVLLSVIAAVIAIAIDAVGATTLANLLLPHPIENGQNYVMTNGHLKILPAINIALTPELVLVGLSFAAALGALGSLYPALKAARTRPAEAMRYE